MLYLKKKIIRNPLWIRIALCIIKNISKLQPKTQQNLGKKLGRLLQKLLASHRKVTAINLNLCFPEESSSFYSQLTHRYFEGFGAGLLECCSAGFTPKDQLPPCQTNGLAEVQALIQAGRPIILVSAHFTTMVMMGRYIAKHFPLACAFRPQRFSPFNSILTEEALKHGISLIPPHLSDIIDALSNKNKIVLYFIDQDHGKKRSIFSPFFGVNAATNKALPFLVKATQAAVVPVFCYRKTDAIGYELTFLPSLIDYPTQDPQQDALRINQLLELAIRKQPELFFWYYKRFRTRPEGEKRIY